MSATKVQKAEELTEIAKLLERPIVVARSTTALAVVESGAVVMKPAVVLRYSVSQPSGEAWTFEEVVFDDGSGRIDLSKTLLHRLETTTGAPRVEKLFRSGSF